MWPTFWDDWHEPIFINQVLEFIHPTNVQSVNQNNWQVIRSTIWFNFLQKLRWLSLGIVKVIPLILQLHWIQNLFDAILISLCEWVNSKWSGEYLNLINFLSQNSQVLLSNLTFSPKTLNFKGCYTFLQVSPSQFNQSYFRQKMLKPFLSISSLLEMFLVEDFSWIRLFMWLVHFKINRQLLILNRRMAINVYHNSSNSLQ